jgi:hypothetical protein
MALRSCRISRKMNTTGPIMRTNFPKSNIAQSNKMVANMYGSAIDLYSAENLQLYQPSE